jgi:hypothetical protein
MAPVFEHFGITVTRKGKLDPWTLKGHGKVIKARLPPKAPSRLWKPTVSGLTVG